MLDEAPRAQTNVDVQPRARAASTRALFHDTGSFDPTRSGNMPAVRCYRLRLSVGFAVCTLVLCWFYVFPGFRFLREKDTIEEVLRHSGVWHKNQTGIELYRCASGLRVLRMELKSHSVGS